MRRRLVTPLLLLALAVVVLVAAWAAWQVWQVNRDLSAAAADAADLQAAVENGDDDAVDDALARLQDHSRSAADRTDTATWSALTYLPAFGDDAEGVRTVSDVMADLSASGIESLATTATDLESLLPEDGRFDVKAVERLQQPVADGKAAFAKADQRLSGHDPSGYAEALKIKYRDLAGRVSDAAAILTTADTALTVMPTMLGADEPRNYLLVFQNNAEIRATGGLPGAVSVLRAEDGKVELTRQVAANTFGKTDKPVLPLTPAEKKIYTEQLGVWFLDANFTPDFPRVAELMRARWEQVHPEKLDGVFALDPVTLSYILKATGPVEVGDVALTSQNAVDELLHQVYLRYDNPIAQDVWFRLVAQAVFDRVSSGVETPQELIRALARGTAEHRVYVHSFDKEEQAALAGTPAAGELVVDPEAAPQVGVYLNDGTAAKMSYFLRHKVMVDATYCRDGVQGLTAKARFTSDAPEDAASLPDYVTGGGRYGIKPGSQLVVVHLYGPVHGQLSRVQLNGKPLPVDVVDHGGRPVATTSVSLAPGATADLTWRMVTGPDQSGNAEVSVTPGVTAKEMSSVAVSACS